MIRWRYKAGPFSAMIGPGHPDQNSGIATLQGTNREERLMAHRVDLMGRRLVKTEWDEIEKWMKAVADVNYRRHNNLPENAPTGNY